MILTLATIYIVRKNKNKSRHTAKNESVPPPAVINCQSLKAGHEKSVSSSAKKWCRFKKKKSEWLLRGCRLKTTRGGTDSDIM